MLSAAPAGYHILRFEMKLYFVLDIYKKKYYKMSNNQLFLVKKILVWTYAKIIVLLCPQKQVKVGHRKKFELVYVQIGEYYSKITYSFGHLSYC